MLLAAGAGGILIAHVNCQESLSDHNLLPTYGVIVGMTGSGKTGLGIGLIEEAAIDGIPALIIDPKGDIANLALFLASDMSSFTTGATIMVINFKKACDLGIFLLQSRFRSDVMVTHELHKSCPTSTVLFDIFPECLCTSASL